MCCRSGAFAARPDGDAILFTIMIRPPNVIGTLHVGHALTMTLQDVLIRWLRMQGRDSIWQPGADHGGIATQSMVERQLDAEGVRRADLGRDPFVSGCGLERSDRATASLSSCAGRAFRWTGSASALPWRRDCPPRCGKPSSRGPSAHIADPRGRPALRCGGR